MKPKVLVDQYFHIIYIVAYNNNVKGWMSHLYLTKENTEMLRFFKLKYLSISFYTHYYKSHPLDATL